MTVPELLQQVRDVVKKMSDEAPTWGYKNIDWFLDDKGIATVRHGIGILLREAEAVVIRQDVHADGLLKAILAELDTIRPAVEAEFKAAVDHLTVAQQVSWNLVEQIRDSVNPAPEKIQPSLQDVRRDLPN